MKNMEKPMYHGQTIIHEIDTAHPIDMRIANQGLVVYEHHNVFPEYFFISVPLFNDVVNSELTEWLYVMKHSDIREDFKSPYMKKVAERLSVLKMDTEERNAYFHYLKEAVQAQDTLTSAKLEGEQVGREKGKIEGEKIGIEKGKIEGKIEGEKIGIEKGEKIGIEKEKMQIAQNMLQLGLPLDTIAAVTGLSVEVIQGLAGDCS
jgi:predicted transposase YdaD